MVRVALIGLGLTAQRFHIPLLKRVKDFECVAAVSSKSDEEASAICGCKVSRFLSVEDLISWGKFDLAIIMTPNHCHFHEAMALLNDSKHVVVDKPFTTTFDEAKALVERAESQDVLLSVFHNRRWDSDFLTAAEVLRTNALGTVTYVESRFDKYRPKLHHRWRELDLPGSGLLYDIGSHLIDQALVLFGVPHSVMANIRCTRAQAVVPDYYSLSLRYQTFEVCLRTSSLAPRSPFRWYMEGSTGSYQGEFGDPQEHWLMNGLPSSAERWQTFCESHTAQVFSNQEQRPIKALTGNYDLYYEDLLEALKTGKKPLVESRQAANVVGCIEAAQLSQLRDAPVVFSGFDSDGFVRWS